MERIIKNKRLMYCLVATFIFGLMAHAFRYFNMAFSHDSADHITERTFNYKLQLGRFTQYFYIPLRNIHAAPWLIGMISLIFVAIAVYLVVSLFDIENENIIILTAGIFATNYTLTLINASFIFTADTYMLSVVLYVLAAYLVIKNKFGWLWGSVCISLGMGLYQAFLPMTILLILFYMFRDALSDSKISAQIVRGVKTGIMFLLAAIEYKIGIWFSVTNAGKVLSDAYNGIDSVGDYSGVNIVRLFGETYLYPLRFFKRVTAYNTEYVRMASIILMFIMVICFMLILFRKDISKANKVFSIMCLVILPLAMNAVYFVSKGMMHDLMIYQFFMIYFFALLVLNCINDWTIIRHFKIKRYLNVVCYVLVGVIVYHNIVYANDVYLKKQLVYENTVSVFDRIIGRIESLDGYVVSEDTELVIIGSLRDSVLNRENYAYDDFDQHGLEAQFSTTHYNTYIGFVQNILNYPITLVDDLVAKEYAKSEEVMNMPVFPYEGSVKWVDGKVVVKLSEEIE